MTRFHTDIRDSKGQTMVELTMIFPVLCVILLGVIQFGIAFTNYLALTDAVREGARKAAVARHTDDPHAVAEQAVVDSADDLGAGLVVEVESTWEPGSDVVVSASYPYSIDLLGVVVKAGSLQSTTTERVE